MMLSRIDVVRYVVDVVCRGNTQGRPLRSPLLAAWRIGEWSLPLCKVEWRLEREGQSVVNARFTRKASVSHSS